VEAPKGIRLGARLGATDRGSLWRATREPRRDRIIRFVDQRLSDGQFKQALAVIRQRERPRMAPIVDHGYSGPHYYLEYEVGAGCQTLEQRMSALPHWRDRLILLRQICEVLPQWLESPIRPLGLNVRDIVMLRTGGQWYPWLLPCPLVSSLSPCDLLDVDRHILATVAPEVIRGVQVDHHGQDSYALGTLAAQAAGCAPKEPAADDAVTDQARNALLRPSAGTSEIPAFLESAAPVRDFFAAIQRYRDADPNARPPDANDLRRAVLVVTDVLALADTRQRSNPDQAVEMLAWLRPDEGERYVRGALQAAEISAELGDLRRAKELTDQVIELVPEYLPARRQRADVLWQLVELATSVGPDDPDGRQLLADLDAIKGDRHAGGEPYRRSALLHRRWDNVAKAADELYEAVELDPTDLDALLLYGQCWDDLGQPANAADVVQEAHHRINRLVMAGMLAETEGQRWHEAFDRLLS